MLEFQVLAHAAMNVPDRARAHASQIARANEHSEDSNVGPVYTVFHRILYFTHYHHRLSKSLIFSEIVNNLRFHFVHTLNC